MMLFTIYDLLTMGMMGMGEKIPRSVTLPSPVYKIGCRLFSGAKEPKKSRTYPRWDGGPSLVGQRNIGLGTVWAVKLQRMWIIYI